MGVEQLAPDKLIKGANGEKVWTQHGLPVQTQDQPVKSAEAPHTPPYVLKKLVDIAERRDKYTRGEY